MKGEFVIDLWFSVDVFVDNPVVGEIQEQIGIIREQEFIDSAWIARSHSERQSTGVLIRDGLDGDDEPLSRHQRAIRKDISVAVVVLPPGGHHPTHREENVATRVEVKGHRVDDLDHGLTRLRAFLQDREVRF